MKLAIVTKLPKSAQKVGEVRLCDCIKCVPDPSDEICLRCVDEQYKYLIETIDNFIDEFAEDLSYSND